jgi:3-isopropylmalate dehydrogenase
VGAAAIDAVSDPFPEETLHTCQQADAIFFGTLGDPKYDNDPTAKVRPEQGLLAMRKALGLFTNIRPVKSYPELIGASPLKNERVEGTDLVIYRELTGGIYFGDKGRNASGNKAYDTSAYSQHEIERISHLAFQAAQKRNKKVTLVDKANVLETSRLWRETVQKLAKQYPGVELDLLFVDNAAMQMIQNPTRFDVILTENMFGDIISDEASVITGSLGMLPSASVGEAKSLFEPVHGSFPQATGRGIANPFATILSAAMMLDVAFDLKTESQAIEDAVARAIAAGKVTADIRPGSPVSTSEAGDAVAEAIKQG